VQFHIRNDNRLLSIVDALSNFGKRPFQVFRIAFDHRLVFENGQFDRHIHDIVWNFNIARAAMRFNFGDNTNDFFGSGFRIEQYGGCAGHFIINAALRIKGAHFVMLQLVALAVIRGGAARNNQHRAFFSIGAGDGIEHVQPADAIGHAGNAQAIDTCISVSGKAYGRFMCHGVEVDLGVFKPAKRRQREIARNAECIADTLIVEIIEQERADRV